MGVGDLRKARRDALLAGKISAIGIDRRTSRHRDVRSPLIDTRNGRARIGIRSDEALP